MTPFLPLCSLLAHPRPVRGEGHRAAAAPDGPGGPRGGERTPWRRAEAASTAPRAPGSHSRVLSGVSHLVPQFPLWYPGVNFRDSCETEFTRVKHSAQSLADGSRDPSVRGETHTRYTSGRQDRGRQGGPSLGSPALGWMPLVRSPLRRRGPAR